MNLRNFDINSISKDPNKILQSKTFKIEVFSENLQSVKKVKKYGFSGLSDLLLERGQVFSRLNFSKPDKGEFCRYVRTEPFSAVEQRVFDGRVAQVSSTKVSFTPSFQRLEE